MIWQQWLPLWQINILHFLCLHKLISKYKHLPGPAFLTFTPIILLNIRAHTHSLSSAGCVECHLQCGPNVAEKRGQGSRSSVRQNISATCHTARRGPACGWLAGWLPLGWASRLTPLRIANIWEFGFQNLFRVTDVGSTWNTSQAESAHEQKVLRWLLCCSPHLVSFLH